MAGHPGLVSFDVWFVVSGSGTGVSGSEFRERIQSVGKDPTSFGAVCGKLNRKAVFLIFLPKN